MLGNITQMRESLVKRGRPDLLPRLDKAEEDLNGLKDSIVREDSVFAIQMMTDSLNSTSGGRKAAASRNNLASSNSPGDSADLRDNDDVDSTSFSSPGPSNSLIRCPRRLDTHGQSFPDRLGNYGRSSESVLCALPQSA